MNIYCEQCAKNVGSVADEKIPANKTVSITCPICKTRIPVRKEVQELKLSMEERPVSTEPEQPSNLDHQEPYHPHQRAKDKLPPVHSQKRSSETESSAGKGGFNLTVIAVGLFLTLFIFIGLRFWAFAKVSRLYELGPSRVSQNEDSIAVYADNQIFHIHKNGQLIKKAPLEELGIDAPITDIELLKNNDVLIGERSNGKIQRCDLDESKCTDISPTGEYAIKDAFRFLANEEAGLLYISDTLNHRLLSQKLDGSSQEIADSDLSYPNDMVIAGGSLYLCDTFNARIIRYEVDPRGHLVRNETPFISLNSLTTPEGLKNLAKMDPESLKQYIAEQKEKIENSETLDFTHDRPISLAQDLSGKWWIGITSEADIFGSEVQLFDSKGTFISKLADPKNSIAEDMTVLDGKVLITDPGLMRVYTIDPSTYTVSDFGDEEFQNVIKSLQTQNSIATFFQKWSIRFMLITGAFLLGLLFYIKSQES